MADIKPFAAFRPRHGMEETIAALPYDVYSSAEARAYTREHPHSFLAIDRAETQLPEGTPFDAPQVYLRARDLLADAIARGDFVQDPRPYYYIYEQTYAGRTQTGIVACASIDDYLHGVIRKHENTREDKERDRIRHVDTCNMQTGPIFLAYRGNDTIREIVNANRNDEPICDFISDGGVRNRVFLISDRNECVLIEHCFRNISEIYIADGHHRCASAVKVGLKRREERRSGQNPERISFGHRSIQNDLFRQGVEESDYFLSVLFPDEELAIMDYNRVLRDLSGLSPEAFLSRIRDAGFHVEGPVATPVHPSERGEFGLCLANGWYLLRADNSLRSDDPVDDLDVSILQNHVLGPILGIGDPRTDTRIDFVGGIRGLGELERRVRTDCAAAFSLYPTSIQELFSVADAGRLMPPKSTWFEPKLLSGLFLHAL